MKKSIMVLGAILLVLPIVGLSQWNYIGVLYQSTQPHGVAVTPDGNIWIAAFGRTGDSLAGRALSSVVILRPDGTPASFSPIRTITVGATTDTLFHLGGSGAARGLNSDNQGNILLSFFDRLYKINYQTGAGMAKAVPRPGASLTMAAADTLGEIFVGHVGSALPIYIFNNNLNSLGNVTDTSRQLSRTVIVSRTGDDFYHGSVAGVGILHYHSDFGSFGPYVLQDTLALINFAESFQWDRNDPSKLWTSSRDNFPPYSTDTWYAFNVATRALVDSIKWRLGGADSLGTPRGIAFSVSGDTAYVAGFDGHTIQMFKRGPVYVRPDPDGVPNGFILSQNYPNPFNPSTTISFIIPHSSLVIVKVYDVLGREVRTLVNEEMKPGSYEVTWDATGFASGVYFYRLQAGSFTETRKLMLLR